MRPRDPLQPYGCAKMSIYRNPFMALQKALTFICGDKKHFTTTDQTSYVVEWITIHYYSVVYTQQMCFHINTEDPTERTLVTRCTP